MGSARDAWRARIVLLAADGWPAAEIAELVVLVAAVDVVAHFQSKWTDLSHVPAELRVPALLICGSEDGMHDAMARAARGGISSSSCSTARAISCGRFRQR
jgi:hypothetical protein